MERRPRRPARQRRLHHGSYGQLLDDEDLLQQCLATLVMDAAILRQQQQLQQEQLKLQQVSDERPEYARAHFGPGYLPGLLKYDTRVPASMLPSY